MYKYECSFCKQCYIGKTKRQLIRRIKEHSELLKHHTQCGNLENTFINSFKVIDKINDNFKICIL